MTRFYGVGSLPYWGWFGGLIAFGLVYVFFLRTRTCPVCNGEGEIDLVEAEEEEDEGEGEREREGGPWEL